MSLTRTQSQTEDDVSTLSGNKWLNDQVINFYFKLTVDRAAQNPKNPKDYALNTFFMVKLLKDGFSKVKQWTKNVDIFEHEIIFIPVLVGK